MKKYLFLALVLFVFISCNTTKNTTDQLNNSSFSASKSIVESNESIVLSWNVPESVKNASISIDGVGENLDYSGSIEVKPQKSQSYKLTVQAAGKTVTKAESITVKSVPVVNISKFEAGAYKINMGQSVNISWQVDNVANEIISIPQISNESLKNSGSINITPDKTQEYVISINKGGEVVTSKKIKIEVVIPVPKVGFSEGPDDGRFTIGGNGKRLMYGWPVPQSTSHFILKVDGNYGSNRPSFISDNQYYLSGEQVVTGEKGSVKFEIPFSLDGIMIYQRLIPVDNDLKPVSKNQFGQYYMVEYELLNISNEVKSVGLISQIDFMIDNNDAAKVKLGENLILNETELDKSEIISDLLIYQDENDNTAARATAILTRGDATTPDNLYIGRWSYLHGVVWNLNIENEKYGDSGMLLKWNEETLAPNETRKISYYYGLPDPGNISAVTSVKDLKLNTLSVYYSNNGYEISRESQNSIDSLINSHRDAIVGVLVSGYTDAKGEDEYNFKLSEKRVQVLTKYLIGKGILDAVIIPKAYGESNAMQNEETKESGNNADRKCVLIFFTK